MAKINKLTLRPPKRDSLYDPVTGLGQILFTRNDDPILFRYSGCSGIHPSSSPPLPHSSIFKHSRLMANWLLGSFSFSFFIQFLLSLLLSKCVFSFHSHHSILPFFLKSRLIQWVFFTGLPGRRPPASMAPDFFFHFEVRCMRLCTGREESAQSSSSSSSDSASQVSQLLT